MRKKEILDLVLNENGEYEPVDSVRNRSRGNGVAVIKRNEIDRAGAFLMGIDYGIEFLEGFMERVNRLNNIIK